MAPDKVIPPGRQRPLLDPTSTGKIPFTYPPTGLRGETAYYLFGELSSATPPLIVLHGGPGAQHEYMLALAFVHADHGIPVLLYDQIGCGASTRFKDKRNETEWWTPELFIAELDNVKSHLGITTFDLAGQSWGGMLAGQYAISQPRGLRKLVVMDAPASMSGWARMSAKYRTALPDDVRDVLDRCEREGTTSSEEYHEAERYFYSLHMCRSEPWPEELNVAAKALREDSTVYESMNGPNEFVLTGSLKEWDISEGLRKVTQETVPGGLLLVNGALDQADDEATGPFFWNPSCRTKWVRFELSSHMPHLEESERFTKLLGSFLTQGETA